MKQLRKEFHAKILGNIQINPGMNLIRKENTNEIWYFIN